MLYLLIACADCDAEFRRPAATLEDMRAAYQFAESTGWTTEGRYVDYCPSCSLESTRPLDGMASENAQEIFEHV